MNADASYTGRHNLTLTILEDHKAIALKAAHRIADALRVKPDLVLGLATGATMEPVYSELVRMHKEEGLDFSKARFFNLDSYKGLPSTDRNSYDFQLRKLLLDKVNAKKENINLVQGIDFDPAAYEAKIKAAGGIDIQLLGLGGEGHIGFNEVGSAFDSRTREVQLHPRTVEDNAMYFNRPGEKVPASAYTMGIGTILEAKEIIVLANNPNKGWAVRNLMEPTGTSSQDLTSLELYQMQKYHDREGSGASVDRATIEAFFEAQAKGARKEAKPVEELPARALHAHKNVTLLVDEEAASMTRLTDLLQKSNLDKSQVQKLVDKFTPRELEVSIDGRKQNLFLPAGFDFYDPKVMELDEKFDPKNRRHVEALQAALAKTTHVGVGAHQDDIEIMAGPMLLKNKDHWMNIIVTDGAASKSILNGMATELTPKQLTDMRQREQREAARETGTPVIQLKYPSAAVNGHMGEGKRQEAAFALGTLFSAMPKTEEVFGHNPIDKHATHLAVLAVQTAALRAAQHKNLKNVYAMEVWGGLTGIPEAQLSMFVVEDGRDLAAINTLIGKYQSQIQGQGRDYAATTTARMVGHGGYVSNPHLNNPPEGMVIGLNITDFTKGESNDMGALAKELLERAAAIKVKLAEKHSIPATPNLSGGFTGALLAKKAEPAKKEL
jgi:glucosamine-6-phosphate deaminase